MAPKKQTKTKVKKKKWVPVLAPKLFNNVVLGETHISDDAQLATKNVTLNLSTVTNDIRKQNYLVRFDVTHVKEGKAHTMLIGLNMTPSGLKRQVRRGRTKVEDSFLTKLKTGQVVRVKPVVVTVNRCSKPARTDIRLAIREKLKQVLANATLDSFVQEVLENKIQRVLKDVAGKHHPTRSADVRAIQLVPGSRIANEEPEEKVEEKAEDKPKKTPKKTEETPKKAVKAPAKEKPVKEAESEKTEEKSDDN